MEQDSFEIKRNTKRRGETPGVPGMSGRGYLTSRNQNHSLNLNARERDARRINTENNDLLKRL